MPSPRNGHAREAQFASKLKEQKIRFIWPSPVIRLPDYRDRKFYKGLKYKPDFYLPDTDNYIEIMGSRQRYSQAKAKIALFQTHFDIKVLLPNGEPYRTKEMFNTRGHLPYRFCCCGKQIWRGGKTGLCIHCLKLTTVWLKCENCGNRLPKGSQPGARLRKKAGKSVFCIKCNRGNKRYNWKDGKKQRAGFKKDKSCPDCGFLIMRISTWCAKCYWTKHNPGIFRRSKKII